MVLTKLSQKNFLIGFLGFLGYTFVTLGQLFIVIEGLLDQMSKVCLMPTGIHFNVNLEKSFIFFKTMMPVCRGSQVHQLPLSLLF